MINVGLNGEATEKSIITNVEMKKQKREPKRKQASKGKQPMQADTKVKLNLGCGINLMKGFINVDKYHKLEDIVAKKGRYKNAQVCKNPQYVQADIRELPFPDNYADYIEACDVIEHIPFRDVTKVFNEIYRVLKPGKNAVIFTTDFTCLARLWIEKVDNAAFDARQYLELTQIIYGNQIQEGEFHKCPFTPTFIKAHAFTAGFSKIEIRLYPMHSTDVPPLKTMEPFRDKWTAHRSDNIWAKMTKPKKTK